MGDECKMVFCKECAIDNVYKFRLICFFPIMQCIYNILYYILQTLGMFYII